MTMMSARKDNNGDADGDDYYDYKDEEDEDYSKYWIGEMAVMRAKPMITMMHDDGNSYNGDGDYKAFVFVSINFMSLLCYRPH